jgi:hypothetical protein
VLGISFVASYCIISNEERHQYAVYSTVLSVMLDVRMERKRTGDE